MKSLFLRRIKILIALSLLIQFTISCKKLVEIPSSPPNQIGTQELFADSTTVMSAVAGIYAAITAWGWSLYASIALFCFPLIVWFAIMLIAGTAAATQALFSGKGHKASA